MTARRLGLCAAAALVAALAGCGSGTGDRTPDLAKLPLVPGAHIATQVNQCDRGAGAFCSLQLVVVDPRYSSSTALVSSQSAHLRQHGWIAMNGDTGEQRAAESPTHDLRVTYATAFGDLKGIDLGWIKRSQAIAGTLSREMFHRSAVMSLMLETGS